MLAGLSYNDRITSGKKVEKQILDSLRRKGYQILDPSSSEDMYDKIDGWWVDKKGGKHPIQVKFRQSGDDILFELVKNLDLGKEGRDMKSKATLYLVANRQGTTRLYQTKVFKDKAKEILDIVEEDLQTHPEQQFWRGNGWEARVQFDRSSGDRKIVAYFKPTFVNPMATWDLHINESVFKKFYRLLLDL